MCDHPDELYADLYEVYGLDLDAAIGSGMQPGPVAALAVQLPPGSRVRVAEDPDAWWTGERILLAGIINSVRSLMWGMADKKKRGRPPEPIGPSWAKGRGGGTRKLAAVAMTREELLEHLSRPRVKEAENG